MNLQHDPESKASLVELSLKLQALFDEHCDKRISVVGTFCTGKTALVRNLPGAQDMDDLLLPKLSKEETECVCTPEQRFQTQVSPAPPAHVLLRAG